MIKFLIPLFFSVFAFTCSAADTSNQTDGAELGTHETPQAQDQSKNSNKSTTSNQRAKKHKHTHTNAHHNHSTAKNAKDNPLQPTETEPAPGASTK